MRMSLDWKVLQEIEVDLDNITYQLAELNKILEKAVRYLDKITIQKMITTANEIVELLDGFTIEGKKT